MRGASPPALFSRGDEVVDFNRDGFDDGIADLVVRTGTNLAVLLGN